VGIVIRQSLKTTVVTLAGAAIGALVMYLSARILPLQELGFSRTLTNFALVSASILVLGFHGTLAVFIYRYPIGDPRRAAFTGLCLTVPLLAIGLVSGIYFASKTWFLGLFQPADIPFFDRYFIWLPVFSLFACLQILLESYLMAYLKVAQYTFVREVGLKGGNLLLILLLGAGRISFSAFIIGSVVLYGLACIVLLALVARTGSFRISWHWDLLTRTERRELLHFAGFHALLGVSINLLNAIDGIMLAPLGQQGLKATGIYAIALFVVSIMLIPMRALTQATTPVITQAYQAQDHAQVASLFRKSSDTMFLASLGMTVIILANLSNGLQLLGNQFEPILYVIPILLVGRLVDAATGINEQLLSISRHYRFSFALSLGLVAGVIVFNWLLIPRWGVIGAATGTTLAVLLYNLGKWYFVKQKLSLQPFSLITLRILAAGILTLSISWLLPHFRSPLLDAALRSACIAIVYALLLLAFKAAPDLLPVVRALRNKLPGRRS
jgi:O-antigen/teichoic acid export membrane protein